MRILCYGDSNTYGYDPRGYWGGRYDAGDRWPELLARQTGWEVLNLGVNGRQIPRGASGLPQMDEADRFLVMLGTNDLLQGVCAAEVAARMETFLHLLPRRNPILLVAPPPVKQGAWVSADTLVTESIRLASEYAALAEKLDIPFIDTQSWQIPLAFDGVHFTEQGHHIFAQRLRQALQPWQIP